MTFNTELVGSTVEMLVLKLLIERAMYGYEIIQIVNDRTDGAFNWKEGTLYPLLHRLEGKGLLATEWTVGDSGKKRKYYKLTKKGSSYADERVAEWRLFSKSVNSVMCAPALVFEGA